MKIFKCVQEENLDALKELEVKNWNVFDRNGLNPLHHGGIVGNLEIFQFLESKGVDPNGECEWDKMLPIHYICDNDHLELLNYVLTNNPKQIYSKTIDSSISLSGISIYISGGKLPIHFAAQKSNLECLEYLIKLDPKQLQEKDEDGNTPLDLAKISNRKEAIEMIETYTGNKTELLTDEQREKIKLSQMKSCMERIKKREFNEYLKTQILQKYTPKHSELFQYDENMFEFKKETLKKEFEGVYSFEFMKKEYCIKFLEEIENILQSDIEINRPNTMNNYGLILEHFGFDQFIKDMMKHFITPLAQELFDIKDLNYHHSFVIRYKIGEDVDLKTHVDKSDITINLCLGKEFEGGNVYFKGLKDSNDDNLYNEYISKVGKAIIHVGNHFHGANPIKTGERVNLIIWCSRINVYQ